MYVFHLFIITTIIITSLDGLWPLTSSGDTYKECSDAEFDINEVKAMENMDQAWPDQHNRDNEGVWNSAVSNTKNCVFENELMIIVHSGYVMEHVQD
jgi:hypothetical protein